MHTRPNEHPYHTLDRLWTRCHSKCLLTHWLSGHSKIQIYLKIYIYRDVVGLFTLSLYRATGVYFKLWTKWLKNIMLVCLITKMFNLWEHLWMTESTTGWVFWKIYSWRVTGTKLWSHLFCQSEPRMCSCDSWQIKGVFIYCSKWLTISESRYLTAACLPNLSYSKALHCWPAVVLCMLIFKPFCTCSIMCDES